MVSIQKVSLQLQEYDQPGPSDRIANHVLKTLEAHGRDILHPCVKKDGQGEISRSANGTIQTFIEQTENVYVVKFQCLINYTLSSGEFANSIFTNRAALGA